MYSKYRNETYFLSADGIKVPYDDAAMFFESVKNINPSNHARQPRDCAWFSNMYNEIRAILSLIKSNMGYSGYQAGESNAHEWCSYTNTHPIWTKYAFIIFGGGNNIAAVYATLDNLGKMLQDKHQGDTGISGKKSAPKNESLQRNVRRKRAAGEKLLKSPNLSKQIPENVLNQNMHSLGNILISPTSTEDTSRNFEESLIAQVNSKKENAALELLLKYGNEQDKKKSLSKIRDIAFGKQSVEDVDTPVVSNSSPEIFNCYECEQVLKTFKGTDNCICMNDSCNHQYYKECGDVLNEEKICCVCRSK